MKATIERRSDVIKSRKGFFSFVSFTEHRVSCLLEFSETEKQLLKRFDLDKTVICELPQRSSIDPTITNEVLKSPLVFTLRTVLDHGFIAAVYADPDQAAAFESELKSVILPRIKNALDPSIHSISKYSLEF